MRLWHKDLIPVLTNRQLVTQWTECIQLAATTNNFDSSKGIYSYVKKVKEYPFVHLYNYGELVYKEMRKRGHNISFRKFEDYFEREEKEYIDYANIFYDWHNRRYLRQCYYILQEKADCGNITETEWLEIHRYVSWRIEV